MWTPEEIIRLKELTKTKTLPAIALELSKTKEEVRYQIRKLGLSTKVPWARPLAEVAEITRYSDRNGLKKTAEFYNITIPAVKHVRNRQVRRLKTIQKNFGIEAVRKLRKQAFYYAVKRGRAEHGEDFGSYAVIYRFTHETVNFEFLWSKYLTDTLGNINSISGKIEADARRDSVSIIEESDYEDSESGVQVVGVDARETEGDLSFEGLIQKFKFKDDQRIIFLLHFKWNLNQVEIAELFNVTNARIQQIISSMITNMKRKIEIENHANGIVR